MKQNKLKSVYLNNNIYIMIPPIIIISFNNYKYVENTINQLDKINKEYLKHIIILDNNSNDIDTIEYLKNLNYKIIYNNENNGPWIDTFYNIHIYNELPEKFILTDPDLEFNKNLPSNFIEILLELSDKYGCHKIGFALDISDYDKMFNFTYVENETIQGWESKFWENRINDEIEYELYYANIDTTFCLINKNTPKLYEQIRVAGNFTAKHIPWYIDNKIYNIYERYINAKKLNKFSTISRLIIPYIENNYFKINKNSEMFLIKNGENVSFWKDVYENWEIETFNVFDNFLDKNKIFIDIGSWIGTTSMYGSRKSKYVYAIEADNKAFNDLTFNMKTNCVNNYTLINNAIFNVNDIEIKFGKNKFLNNSKLNDSTSQIYLNENDPNLNDSVYLINTITINKIIEKYNINASEISLIKVDIEGGEENILNDLLNINKLYKIPLYVSFHFDWWSDKDLNRFELLTENQKNEIRYNPFTSILFL
jgi:FkbM family methyltransferase